jgi:hypothetical protein
MNSELRKQIHNELNLKVTEELLEIWYTNDHEEWSDTAFDVIKEILIERLGEIPTQEKIVNNREIEETTLADDGLEEWEVKLLDDENQPELYDTLEVITLKDHINKTSTALVIVYALVNLMNIRYYIDLVGSYFPNHEDFILPIYFIAFVVALLSAAISIAIVYFPLRALGQILRILMEMEFISRKAS